MMKQVGSVGSMMRIICAVLLLSLGFAHKPVHAQPLSDPTNSYYLLPDGTYAELCIEDVDHGKPQKSWLGSGCDACRLASGIALPAPPADIASRLAERSEVLFPQPLALLRGGAWRPGSPVRGPPFLSA